MHRCLPKPPTLFLSRWRKPRAVFAVLLALLSGSLFLITAAGPYHSAPDVPPGPNWTLLNSPNINNGLENNFLVDVACITADDCWSVGSKEHDSDDSTGRYETLIQHWNGSNWSVVDSPTVVDSPQKRLYGIACNSSTDCWAVGYSLDQSGYAHSLVERWDGGAWSIVASPTDDNGYFRDVACTGPNECWAVGYSAVFSDWKISPLVEYWNGTSWTIVESATSNEASTSLSSVSCVATSDCWASGYSAGNGSSHHTFVEHWDGNSWSAVASPNPASTLQNDLNQVTCNSSTDCWAVGSSHVNNNTDLTLIEHWDGAAWTIVNSPSAGNANRSVLNGVKCTMANDCWATGYTFSNTQGVALILHWNGSAWSQATSASKPDEFSTLYGVTCVSGSDCWSVGGSIYAPMKTHTEHWNGISWALVASPTINDGPRDNGISAIDCTAADNCWAVGSYEEEPSLGSVSGHGLLTHWDGNGWTLWGTFGDAGFNEGFWAVDCITSSDCWAVGTSNIDETFTAHWDGVNWNIVPSPNIPDPYWGANGVLFGLTCNSSADCWAVGYSRTEFNRRPLIEHWDGTAWAIFPAPDIGNSDAPLLSAVTCISSTDCFAVGNGDYNHGTVILHWNGSIWSLQSTLGNGYLDGITCPQANDCWVVGRFNHPNVTNAMIAHWDGSAWSPLADNTATGSYDELHSVTCPVPERCYAVGYGTSLIKEWKSGAWATVPIYDIPSGSGLFGVNCVAGGYCFAVGSYGGYQKPDQTIIEGRTLTDGSPTPTPTPTATPSPTPTLTPTPAPTATPTPSPTPSPTSTATPIVSISASPSQVREGNDATFTISATANTVRPVTVFYSTSGKAVRGTDYTLSGTLGQVTIFVGQNSASITLHAFTDGARKEKSETVTMTLRGDSNYTFPPHSPPPKKKKKKKKKRPTGPPAVTVTIVNVK